MKKSLLFLSAVALMASCTNDLVEETTAQKAAKGIAFSVSETRGQVNDDWSSFFYAEQDRVNIYANNVKTLVDGASVNSFAAPFTYKATKSQGNPLLTGVNDANILAFKGTDSRYDQAQFFVAYPTTAKVTPTYSGTDLQKFTMTPATDLTSQDMKGSTTMNFDARLMYDYTGNRLAQNNYDGVGEKIDINLTSPLSMLYFVLNDVESYPDFGKLQKIELKANSAKKADGTATDPSALSYAVATPAGTYTAAEIENVAGTNYVKSTLTVVPNAKYTAADLTDVQGVTYVTSSLYETAPGSGVYYVTSTSIKANAGDAVAGSGTHYETNAGSVAANVGDVKPAIDGDVYEITPDNKATLKVADPAAQSKAITLNVNTTWNNTAKANMFVLPAVRKDVKTDQFIVTYRFQNVDLAYSKKTSSANWEANASYGFPSKDGLNISSEFPYIVTRGTANDRVIYINSGDVKQILNADGNTIKWTDARQADGKVPFSQIQKIYIRKNVKNLEDADWAALNKLSSATELYLENATPILKDVHNLTNLTTLEAKNVTEVALNAKINTGVKVLKLDNVTSYKDTPAFTALTDLNLGSYTFTVQNEEVANLFFNSNVQGTLENLDIHSVTSLAPVFGYERNILFTNYTALKTIKLNATKTIISANEFKGCTSLNTVEGKVEMSTASSAFENCSDLSTVNVCSTAIPAAAFKGSKVANVKYNDAQIVPTMIGKEAFANNSAINVMDLTAITGTNLGASAFAGASNFIGNDKANQSYVVTLKVDEVPASAFAGTKVVRFQLINATKAYDKSLNSSALKQIKFRKACTTVGSLTTSASNVDVFIHNVSEASKYEGTYRTVTVEDYDWDY